MSCLWLTSVFNIEWQPEQESVRNKLGKEERQREFYHSLKERTDKMNEQTYEKTNERTMNKQTDERMNKRIRENKLKFKKYKGGKNEPGSSLLQKYQ